MLSVSSAIHHINNFVHYIEPSQGDLRVTETVNEWLLAVTIPLVVFISSGVPHDLVHDPRNSDGMGAGAVRRTKPTTVGVSHVTLVVWGVKTISVPA